VLGVLLARVLEGVLAHALEGHGLEKRAGMMRSVSMSLPGRGCRGRRSAALVALWSLISGSPSRRDGAGDGGGGDHGRAHEERAPGGAALRPMKLRLLEEALISRP
jgi:hypothetical protein